MKGPGLRIDLDVRRIWRCAKCGKTLRTPGHVTAQRCGCSDETPWMRLELPPKRQPFQPPQREPLPEFDEEPAAPPQASDTEHSPAGAAVDQGATVDQPPAENLAAEAPQPLAAAVEVPPTTSAAADDFGAGLSTPSENAPEPAAPEIKKDSDSR